MIPIKPMLAESTDKPFDRKDWLYEQKLDGVRCIAQISPFLEKTELQTRTGNNITHKFPELANLYKQVTKPCILDGELTSVSFNAIQHRIHQEKPLGIRIAQSQYPVIYHVFDIVFLNYNSVKAIPLIERKAILNSVFAESYQARQVAWQTGYGKSLFDKAKEGNLEGIMAKHIYSPYVEKRSDSWLKIKNFKEATYYICGLTEGENERTTTFGSVILGQKVNGKLAYVGNVGSGFNHDQLRMLLYLLDFMKGDCPFDDKPNTDRIVKFWTRPLLRMEVRYLELTPDGKLRFPTFRKLVK